MQDEFVVADNNGVAGVIAPLVSYDMAKVLGQYVDDLAFAFVPPLGSNNYYIRHNNFPFYLLGGDGGVGGGA